MTTQKIDLTEARRLNRIHSGKEQVPSRFEEKLKEVQLKMETEQIIKEIEELKKMLTTSDKVQKDERPLNIRAMAFIQDSDAREKKDQEVQRIYKCLLEADSKKRAECLKNCK